jgi:hypothetical protein
VKLASILAVALLVFALVAMALLYTQQRRILFPAPSHYPQDAPAGFRLVHTQTEDGLRLSAFYRPAPPGLKTILFFHGNGDNMLGAIEATRGPAAAGHGLMLVEYRGYAGNPGSPSEAGLYRDGDAAMRWLADAGVDSRNIVVVGEERGAHGDLELKPGKPIAIAVKGWRGSWLKKSDAPRVLGEAWLDQEGAMRPLEVRAENPKQGAFTFYFTASKKQ